jgi:hypothetical protein
VIATQKLSNSKKKHQMRKALIQLFILYSWFGSYTITAQNNCENDSIRYLVAYNYIINDSINTNKRLGVSDSIVDLDRFWFSHQLDSLPLKKAIVDTYRSNKDYKWFKTYHAECLDFLSNKNKQGQYVIFFSQIEDDMLRVDVLPVKNSMNNTKHYDKLASFTNGYIYLFIFSRSTIQLVFSNKIIYD